MYKFVGQTHNNYIPLVWAKIHCESKMEKHDLQYLQAGEC